MSEVNSLREGGDFLVKMFFLLSSLSGAKRSFPSEMVRASIKKNVVSPFFFLNPHSLLGLLRLLFQFEWELPVLEHNAWLAKSWNSVGTLLWLLSL